MAINWDDYRYFLAVAEAGSLSAAARQLGVAQPTVGRRVQALEKQLKAQLFEHQRSGYTLTSLGQGVLDQVRELESQTLALERLAVGADARVEGHVCIATTEGLGFWLAGKLPLLREQHPKLDIELAIDMGMADLLRREVDIALRVGAPGSDELVGRVIGQIDVGLFASDSYLERYGVPCSLEALASHTVIYSTRDITNLKQANRLQQLAKDGQIGLRCNDILVQMGAAKAGVGLMALPVYYPPLFAPELRQILRKEFALTLELWLLIHRDLRQTGRVRAVLEFIGAQVAENRLLLTGRAS